MVGYRKKGGICFYKAFIGRGKDGNRTDKKRRESGVISECFTLLFNMLFQSIEVFLPHQLSQSFQALSRYPL